MELNYHKEYSKTRLKIISSLVDNISELKNNNLCIYTTGSYGRLEASDNSDLDLFFIDSDENKPTSNIDKTLINAEVIKICRGLKLPEFSKDGGYLTIHNIGEIMKDLGSPRDDYYNYFTARMLLLLESKPIHNDILHKSCLTQIIEKYYIDFHDHSQNFKPIFLANDIIRFWKTLCLNYEHKRKRVDFKNDNSKFSNKVVTHSKNLKLKFSRKLTCFSFILKLAAYEGTINPNEILEICQMTPIERLTSLKDDNHKLSGLIQDALNSYQWFIDRTQIPSEDMLKWISDKQKRDEAFDKSRFFANQLFEILESVDNQNILNRLLI